MDCDHCYQFIDKSDCNPSPLWRIMVLSCPKKGTSENAEPKCHDEVTLSTCSDLEKNMLNMNCGITNYGLSCLKEAIQEHELCVLVHNNTFRTATKNEEETYFLETNRVLNELGSWEMVNSSLEVEHIQEDRESNAEEGENNGAENIGEGEAGAEEGDNNGAEDIGEEEVGAFESDDSGDSMETHVGGRGSPNTILDSLTSSSSDDSF